MKLAPNADDLWIWSMAMLNKTEICVVENNITRLVYVNPAREYGITTGFTLYKNNIQGGNDAQLRAILKHYPEIKTIISKKRNVPRREQVSRIL